MEKRYELTPHRSFDKGYGWHVHPDHALHPEAALASQIIERWALVAGVPDGEDSAGRQKLRLPTPQELVERACDIAKAAIAQYEERGWIQKIPPSGEAEKAWKEKFGKNGQNDD